MAHATTGISGHGQSFTTTQRIAHIAVVGVVGTVVEPVAARQQPAAPAPGTSLYTVVAGDYLTGIANKLHIPFADLLSLNHLVRSSVIHPGMQLIVPVGVASSPPAPATHGTGRGHPAHSEHYRTQYVDHRHTGTCRGRRSQLERPVHRGCR